MQKDYRKAKLNPDKPIELATEDDKLSFGGIVEAVIDLLNLPQRPFTFGLFGKWGTGKSTLLNEIQKRLDAEDYYVVTFDAWKYEGDALRRSFLISIASQLNEKTRLTGTGRKKSVLSDKFLNELKENTYHHRSESQTKPNINVKGILLASGVFIVLLAAQVLSNLYAPDEYAEFLKISPLIIAFIIGIISILGNVLSPSVIGKQFIKQINVGTDKLSSPEEFYEKFLEILRKTKGKTLLVIIDNLDRTQKDATVELLGTIKTFLNPDNGQEDVIFLVASDHKAIKRHIKDVYSKSEDDAYEAEEFIKKFFNAVIEIPPFVSSEYTNYIIDLIQKSGLGILKSNQEDIVGIILAAYPDNPRGAKHFVNSIVVYLIMLSSIGHKAGIGQEFIQKNLNFIATMLVIRDRFDEVYDRIQTEALAREQSWDEIRKIIAPTYSPENAWTSKERDFSLFYDAFNSWVFPESGSLKWFFNMRRSSEEQKLPSWDAFASSVNKNDHERAVKYLIEFNDEPVVLNTLLQQHIRNIKNDTPRWTAFTSVYISFLTSTTNLDLNLLSGSIRDTLRAFPSTSEFAKFIKQINSGKLIELLSKSIVSDAERRKVRTTINGYLKLNNSSTDTLLEVVLAETASTTPNQSTIQAVSSHINSKKDFTESAIILNALVALDDRQEFIKSDANDSVLQALTQSDLDDEVLLDAKLSFVKQARYVDGDVLTKMVQMMDWLQSSGNESNRSIVSQYLYDILKLSKEDILKYTDISYLQNITQYLIAWYQQSPQAFKRNRSYVLLLILLADLEGNAYSPSAYDIAKQFIDAAEADDLSFVLERQDPSEASQRILSPALNERILKDKSLLEKLEKTGKAWLPNDLNELAFYIVQNLHLIKDENSFVDAVNLSKDIIDRGGADDVEYIETLHDSFNNLLPRFSDPIHRFVYKKNDNILKPRPDLILNLKRSLRQEE